MMRAAKPSTSISATILMLALLGAPQARAQAPETTNPQPQETPDTPGVPEVPPDVPDARTPPQPDTGSDPDDFPDFPPFPRDDRDPAFRVGGDYTLGAGEEVDEVVVISGDARIEGRVDGDVLVILGSASVAGTAVIDGSLIVIAGRATIGRGAQIDRDFVVVGGTVDAPPGFRPGNEHIIIGTEAFGVRIDPLVPWVTQGLLWGRPIVPWLGWIWGVVAFAFLVGLALNVLVDRPVQACARTLSERPLTSLGVGLLALLLVGPVFLLLAVSVVGIVVIPFAVCALLLAAILGRVGVARAIGLAMMGRPDEHGPRPSRGRATLAFVIGCGVLVLAYMIPILGLIAWTMVGVFGLGAATLAFVSGYRRENRVPNGPPPAFIPLGAQGEWRDTPPSPAAHASAAPAVVQEVRPPMPAPAAASESGPSVGGPPADSWGAVPPGVPPAEPALPPHTFGPPAGAPPAGDAGAALLSFRRGFFRERLAAFVLDVLLVAIAVMLIGIEGERTVMLVLLVYYIGFWTWKGTTVGGIICGLRVVRLTGTPLQFSDALVRGLTGILSLAALGLGGFWILIDPERQAWHDKVAGTYVVKVPHGWPV